MTVVAFDPNPLNWIKSGANSIVDSAVNTIILRPVVAAAKTVVKAMLGFFNDSSAVHLHEPGTWWNGPSTQAILGKVLALSALVMLAFVFIAVIQGALAGDAGSVVRTVAKEAPISVFAITGLVAVADLLLSIIDSASAAVMSNTASDWTKAVTDWGAVADLSVGGWLGVTAIVVFIIGSLFVWIELIIRSSLIYLLIAVAPLFFAARVWAPAKAPSRKLVEVGLALILSKFVVALALALGAAALASGGDGTLTAEQVTSGRNAYITQQCVSAANPTECNNTAGARFDRSIGGEDSFVSQQCADQNGGDADACKLIAKQRYRQLAAPAKNAHIAQACAGKQGGEGVVCAEQAAKDFEKNADDTSFASKLGGVLAGAALSLLAAFAPFLLLKLVPIAEAALVAQGIKGAPARAGMQVAATVSSARLAGAMGGGAAGGGGGCPIAGSGPAGGGGSGSPKPTGGGSRGGAAGSAPGRPAGAEPGGGTPSEPAASLGTSTTRPRTASTDGSGRRSRPSTSSASGRNQVGPSASAPSAVSSPAVAMTGSDGAPADLTSSATRPVRPVPVGVRRPADQAGGTAATTANSARPRDRARDLGGS